VYEIWEMLHVQWEQDDLQMKDEARDGHGKRPWRSCWKSKQDEYLPIWREETNETSLEAGIRVQIHSQEEPPYIHQLGFGVSPGFQTFVSCQEQRLTYLPQPWGNCRSSTEQLIPGYDTYSISACRLHCETRAVLQECHCRMVHMPGNADICPPNKIKCVDRALALLQKSSGDSCPCETPCNLTRYGKELSMVKIPSKGSARYLSRKYHKSEDYIRNSSSTGAIQSQLFLVLVEALHGVWYGSVPNIPRRRDNFLVLDIFFEALNYETIEQKKAYDVAGLLGDIGGQMGLFIGASILTVLEILDYIYEVNECVVVPHADGVIKHRLQRLLKPQKEQKPQPQQKQPVTSTVATVNLEDMKAKDGSERGHSEGAYANTILPNHHHHLHLHHSRHTPFEDFAC
ncbi:hypothetical protein NFI96_030029, partial [Prochilodus magdalenae]